MQGFPNTTSAREIQRNYRRLFDAVKKSKKPLIVMRNNKPEVAIIDMQQFEEFSAFLSVKQSLKQIKAGKAKLLTSLAEL